MQSAIIACVIMKKMNAKDHLKKGAFKSMINQKHCTRHHQWRKLLHNETLKSWLKKLNLSAKDVMGESER